MFRAILVIAATLTSLVSIEFFIVPYAWICLVWLIVFLHATKASQNSNAKAVWFNLSVILLVLGGFETYLYIKDIKYNQTSIFTTYRNKDGEKIDWAWATLHDVLGYAPKANTTVYARKDYLNELIYDVVYTIDSNGLRISPPARGGNNIGCVAFFGGSLTFGEGLNDNETMPYITGVKTNGRYRIYNFGFPGYGPHQMLASLEHGRAETIMKCQPKYAVYQAINAHILRSAGLASWDKHGPKYILSEKSEIVYKGHFDDGNTKAEKIVEKVIYGVPKPVRDELNKSLIIQKISFKQKRATNRDDISLTIGIVETSKKIFETRYPGSEFHVIFWDEQGERNNEEFLAGMKRKGIRVHLVSNILPDYYTNISKYQLSEYDGHSNQLANKIIAEYVSSKIIRE